MPALAYPTTADTPLKRFHYVVRARERLRRLHNARSANRTSLRDHLGWVKRVWRPQHQRLSRAYAAMRQTVVPLPRGATDQEYSAILSPVKALARARTTWDTSAEMRAIIAAASLSAEPMDPVDPYEDFTGGTWVEADPGTEITRATNTVTLAAYEGRHHDAWVYGDYGASRFGTSFTHEVVYARTNDEATAWMCPWAVSNVIGVGLIDWNSGGDAAVGLWHSEQSGTGTLFLKDFDKGGASDSDAHATYATTFTLYIRVVRSGALGVTYNAYIYTTDFDDTLLDTLTFTGNASTAYRYVYVVQSFDDSTTTDLDGTVSNLDLNEAAGGLSIPIAMHHYAQIGAH